MSCLMFEDEAVAGLMPAKTLIKANDYLSAYNNAVNEVVLVAKGTTSGSNVPIASALYVPKEAIVAISGGSYPGYFFQVGDCYNTSSLVHLQACLYPTGVSNLGFFYNGSAVSNASYEWYYR